MKGSGRISVQSFKSNSSTTTPVSEREYANTNSIRSQSTSSSSPCTSEDIIGPQTCFNSSFSGNSSNNTNNIFRDDRNGNANQKLSQMMMEPLISAGIFVSQSPSKNLNKYKSSVLTVENPEKLSNGNNQAKMRHKSGLLQLNQNDFTTKQQAPVINNCAVPHLGGKRRYNPVKVVKKDSFSFLRHETKEKSSSCHDLRIATQLPSWFFPKISRDGAEALLTFGKGFGNVLVRKSTSYEGNYVISARYDCKGVTEIRHYEVSNFSFDSGEKKYLLRVIGQHPAMDSLDDVLEYFLQINPGMTPLLQENIKHLSWKELIELTGGSSNLNKNKGSDLKPAKGAQLKRSKTTKEIHEESNWKSAQSDMSPTWKKSSSESSENRKTAPICPEIKTTVIKAPPLPPPLLLANSNSATFQRNKNANHKNGSQTTPHINPASSKTQSTFAQEVKKTAATRNMNGLMSPRNERQHIKAVDAHNSNANNLSHPSSSNGSTSSEETGSAIILMPSLLKPSMFKQEKCSTLNTILKRRNEELSRMQKLQTEKRLLHSPNNENNIETRPTLMNETSKNVSKISLNMKPDQVDSANLDHQLRSYDNENQPQNSYSKPANEKIYDGDAALNVRRYKKKNEDFSVHKNKPNAKKSNAPSIPNNTTLGAIKSIPNSTNVLTCPKKDMNFNGSEHGAINSNLNNNKSQLNALKNNVSNPTKKTTACTKTTGETKLSNGHQNFSHPFTVDNGCDSDEKAIQLFQQARDQLKKVGNKHKLFPQNTDNSSEIEKIAGNDVSNVLGIESTNRSSNSGKNHSSSEIYSEQRPIKHNTSNIDQKGLGLGSMPSRNSVQTLKRRSMVSPTEDFEVRNMQQSLMHELVSIMKSKSPDQQLSPRNAKGLENVHAPLHNVGENSKKYYGNRNSNHIPTSSSTSNFMQHSSSVVPNIEVNGSFTKITIPNGNTACSGHLSSNTSSNSNSNNYKNGVKKYGANIAMDSSPPSIRHAIDKQVKGNSVIYASSTSMSPKKCNVPSVDNNNTYYEDLICKNSHGGPTTQFSVGRPDGVLTSPAQTPQDLVKSPVPSFTQINIACSLEDVAHKMVALQQQTFQNHAISHVNNHSFKTAKCNYISTNGITYDNQLSNKISQKSFDGTKSSDKTNNYSLKNGMSKHMGNNEQSRNNGKSQVPRISGNLISATKEKLFNSIIYNAADATNNENGILA